MSCFISSYAVGCIFVYNNASYYVAGCAAGGGGGDQVSIQAAGDAVPPGPPPHQGRSHARSSGAAICAAAQGVRHVERPQAEGAVQCRTPGRGNTQPVRLVGRGMPVEYIAASWHSDPQLHAHAHV